MKAMIFAAGFGTRLKPFTLDTPKALFPINNVSLLERNIKYLKSYGINDLVINVHYLADQIYKFLDENDNFGCKIFISDETTEILETGGGLLKVKDQFNTDFLVMNVDILTNLNLQKMIAFHFENNKIGTLAVMDRESSRKLMFNKDMKLSGWINFKSSEVIVSNSNVFMMRAFSGIHILSPKIFDLIEEAGKFSIMKTYMRLMTNNDIYGYDHSQSNLIDVGKPESVALAEQLFT